MKEYFVWLAKLLTVLAIIFFVIPGLFIGVLAASKAASSTPALTMSKKNGTVAIIDISGAIEDSKDVLSKLHEEIEDKKVSGIVLRINTPGGAVGPSQEIFSAIQKLKAIKPIVASMGTVAASGGFYLSSAATKILAQPGTMTGSIGVIMQIPNFTKVIGLVGVDVITVKSGALKDVGNSFREMSPEERTFLETTARTVHNQFIRDVSDARGLDVEAVRAIADGRVILGEDALKYKLIDGYGDIYDAARMVFEIKGKPLPAGEYPEMVSTKDKFEEFKKYFETVSNIGKYFSSATSLRFEMVR